MRLEVVAARIPMSATSVYVAFPTSCELVPIYPGYTTLVSSDHAKVGIAMKSFESRKVQYRRTFQSGVSFFPILELPSSELRAFESRFLPILCERFHRSGRAREWFRTVDRQGIAEVVWQMHAGA